MSNPYKYLRKEAALSRIPLGRAAKPLTESTVAAGSHYTLTKGKEKKETERRALRTFLRALTRR